MMDTLYKNLIIGSRTGTSAPQLAGAVFLMIFVLSSVVTAQWDTQSPVPTYLDVRGVAAPTPQRVFIATDDNSFDDGGSLFESADGGVSWIQRDVPFSLGSPLNGIYFLDANLGWTFGNENFRTTDGGDTWTQLPVLGSIYFMKFYTPSFGLANGGSFKYISHDSGLSWEESPNNIFAFDFSDEETGLGVSPGGIYRTDDGGATLTLVQAGGAAAVSFLSSDIAVAIVDDSFMRSTDGGATWTGGESAEGKSKLLPVSADVLLAWGRTGSFPDYDDRIFRSADAGLTWTDLGEIMDPGAFITSFTFAVPDAQTVVASDGVGNMFRSADAGLTWAQTYTSPGPRPGFLSSAVPVFADAQTGYYGFGAGFAIKTSDGGASWSQISSGSGQTLNGLDRFPNGDLIAVGEGGTLLTSNGSAPWIIHLSFTSLDLMAVQVVGEDEVVTVDESGLVYSSSDGGSSWTAAASAPANLDAEDLHFTTLLDGWVTGSGSIGAALFHTTDGGVSWTAIPGFGGLYKAVDIEGESGWAVNVGGPFYRTIDGGETWTGGTLPGSPLQIQDMDFFDVATGYAVGWWGFAARSDDGGATWEELPTPNSDDHLMDIYLLGANELWVSTIAGVAYYTANGGQNWAVLEIGSEGFGDFTAIAASPGGDAWTTGFQGYIEHFSGPPPPPLNQPPDASFEFQTTGLSVEFTDTSTDPDGFITAWSWNFGDGSSSSEQHPAHTFEEANTYIVSLTVTDDDNESTGTVRFIVVQPGPGGTFGDFTEVTPLDSLFVTPQDEDFWVITTAPADYDGDGDLDVAVLGYYVVYNKSVDYRLVLLRNDGPAAEDEWEFAYIDVPLNEMSSGSSDLAWGDVDGDGDEDLLVASDGVTVIYRNDEGTLLLTDTELPAYWEDNDQADFDLRSVTWADYDNDGDLDLLLPSIYDDDTFSYRTALMRNDGTNGSGGWIFTETDSVFAPTPHGQSAWADFDGDQDLDLLLINIAPLTDSGFIRRYRNDGNGVFFGEDILGELTIEHGEAQWGDYDSDGDLDILVAGHIKQLDGTYTQALRIYRNDDETYVMLEVLDCPICDGWLDLTAGSWADYDSDGDMDILLAGSYNSGSQIEGRARVYINSGGTFSDSGSELPAPQASGTRGGTFSWLDIDGEGDLDYFIAGQYYVPGGNGLVEAQMHVYRNDVPGQNAAPGAPGNLSATVEDGGTVLLSWTPASDDHTPVAALTYDFDLYRDGVPVASPRRLPEPGNVSAVTDWLLTGLPDGQYEWTLRAVDAAYAGGPSVTEAFTIGDLTSVDPEDLPRTFSFEKGYPNPFNPTTNFEFQIAEFGRVQINIYDIQGRMIKTIINEEMTPGRYTASWNGTNEDGQSIASGTYFVRMSTTAFSKTQRATLLK